MYISNGNTKVKAQIFNLPAGTTCKSCLQCQKYCYAKKAERLYPNVRPCRVKNLKASKRASFVEKVRQAAYGHKYFRIHESGDFYSVEYILKWYDIAKQSPDTIFYCYTKRDDLFTNELLKHRPINLIIYYSVDGIDGGLNGCELKFDGLASVSATHSSCPAQSNDNVKCMRDCFKCAQKGNLIVFKKH